MKHCSEIPLSPTPSPATRTPANAQPVVDPGSDPTTSTWLLLRLLLLLMLADPHWTSTAFVTARQT